MAKTNFIDGNPSQSIQGTVVTAAFLNALNNHRHMGTNIDGDGAIDYAADTGAANAYVVNLAPAVTSHVTGMPIRFKAANANTGASTININGLGTVAIKRLDGSALKAGDIPVNGMIMVICDGTYYQLVSTLNSISTVAVQGAFKNLKIDSLGVNNYNCVITADEVVLGNSSNQYLTFNTVNKTVNANGTVGAPLSIMSARAASTWYFRWLWYNDANGLTATLDVSSTAPTAPTGYSTNDYKALLPGACRTDASGNKYLLQISTRGHETEYIVLAGSNVANLPIMASGAAGDVAVPTWVAIAVGSFAPPNAVAIEVLLNAQSMQKAMVAPNNSYGGYSSQTNPPPISIASTTGDGTGYGWSMLSKMFFLESTNIYWASSGSAIVAVTGWKDTT